MQSERGIGFRGRIEQPILNHAPGAGVPLLAGLEHEFDGPRQLVAMAVQEMHRRDQHGRVRIMAAGVHASGDFAGELEPRFFRHRQRVHVAAQQDRPAALRAGLGASQ